MAPKSSASSSQALPAKFKKLDPTSDTPVRGRYNSNTNTFVTQLEDISTSASAAGANNLAAKKLQEWLKSEIENGGKGEVSESFSFGDQPQKNYKNGSNPR